MGFGAGITGVLLWKEKWGHAWGDLVLIFFYCIIAYNIGNIELFA